MSELKHMHAKTECLPFNTEDVRLIITERYGKQEIRMHGEDARFIVEAIAAANRRTQPEATKPAQDLSAEKEAELFDLARAWFGMDLPFNAVKGFAAALASPADALVAGDRVDARKAVFAAYSHCLANGDSMLPQEIADHLIAAIQAQKDGHK